MNKQNRATLIKFIPQMSLEPYHVIDTMSRVTLRAFPDLASAREFSRQINLAYRRSLIHIPYTPKNKKNGEGRHA